MVKMRTMRMMTLRIWRWMKRLTIGRMRKRLDGFRKIGMMVIRMTFISIILSFLFLKPSKNGHLMNSMLNPFQITI